MRPVPLWAAHGRLLRRWEIGDTVYGANAARDHRRRRVRRHRRGDRAAAATASRDVTILERAPELGGTWFYNSYPGAACDVPSHLYSFSFAQRRDWSRLCSPQPEILDYLRGVAREHGVDRRSSCRTPRSPRCAWDDDARAGRSTTADGRDVARPTRVIVATGQLHQPGDPAHRRARRRSPATASTRPRGTTTTTCAASASRSIGTGASAVQFVPEIAERGRAGSTSSSARATGSCRARNRPYPAPVRGARSSTSRACRRSGAGSCSTTASR